jgi:hypothetical protein
MVPLTMKVPATAVLGMVSQVTNMVRVKVLVPVVKPTEVNDHGMKSVAPTVVDTVVVMAADSFGITVMFAIGCKVVPTTVPFRLNLPWLCPPATGVVDVASCVGVAVGQVTAMLPVLPSVKS